MQQKRFSGIKVLCFTLLMILSGAPRQASACGTIIGSINSQKVNDIYVSEAYAYFTFQSGLKILDISDPSTPTIIGQVSIGEYCGKFDILGTYAYVTENRIASIWPEITTLGYFNVVDISDPQNPFIVNSIQIFDEPYHYVRDIHVSGSYAYIVTNDQGMKVYNISNPENPTFITSFLLDSSWASSINISGNYAYVGTADEGLKVIDISDPESPTIVQTVDIYGPSSSEIVGDYLYAATGNLVVLDISDPQNPFQIGFVATPKIATDVAVIGSYAFVADGSDTGGATLMIDISDLDNPVTICSIPSVDGPGAVFASDPYVYAGDDFGFHIISFDFLRKPTIAQTPMYGPPGTTFTQWGTGFTPSSTVTLHFRNHLGEELLPLQVDTNGFGAFEYVYNSPLDKPEGTHTWWAVDDASGGRSQTLAYKIVVNAGQTAAIISGQTQSVPPASGEEKFGELIPHAGNFNFKPDKDTFVIVHGWNRTDSTVIPGWVALMGADIANDSSAQGSNVYYWNWMEQAKSPNPEDWLIFEIIPYGRVAKSGENLAKQLRDIISPYSEYDHDIHFIGFSLGSGVIVLAAKYIFENDSEFTFKDKLTHLTMFDSPWYIDRPGGRFLRNHEDDFFLENYYSALGKATGYWEADTNIYLQKSPSALLAIDIYGDPHGYSREWYRSSITNFSDPDILGDLAPPPATMPYGFYWGDKGNQGGAATGYIQESIAPHWFLRPFLNYIASGIIVDTAYYTSEMATETWAELNDFAERSGKKIKLLTVNTYNSVADTAGYVKDELSHAFHEAFQCSGIICGALRLENHSASIVTTDVQIPAQANGMTFGFDFQYASPGTIIEVFIEDQLMFQTYSHDAVGKGYQLAPWIDISQFAGEQKPLTFRISNAAAETEGAVRIDDIIWARIENQLFGDSDEDCDVDGYDLAMFAASYSVESLDNFTFSFGKDCL